MAALQASDDILAIYRSFKQINARVLLALELELNELEKELFALELTYVEDPKNQHLLTGISRKEGEDKRHKELLQTMKERIKEYGALHTTGFLKREWD